MGVAPFTGAWIEISMVSPIVGSRWSLPSRERGLKFVWAVFGGYAIIVAPFTGAWIEIASDAAGCAPKGTSLPSRERGLKLFDMYPSGFVRRSLPSRERGLK